jgi:hypothetical protein
MLLLQPIHVKKIINEMKVIIVDGQSFEYCKKQNTKHRTQNDINR